MALSQRRSPAAAAAEQTAKVSTPTFSKQPKKETEKFWIFIKKPLDPIVAIDTILIVKDGRIGVLPIFAND